MLTIDDAPLREMIRLQTAHARRSTNSAISSTVTLRRHRISVASSISEGDISYSCSAHISLKSIILRSVTRI